MFADLMVFSTEPVGKKKLPTLVSCTAHAPADRDNDKSMSHDAGRGLGAEENLQGGP